MALGEQESSESAVHAVGCILIKIELLGVQVTSIEYVWMQSDTNVTNFVGNPYWSMIPGATGESYSPGAITETTYYLRCSRNEGSSRPKK